MSAIRKKAIELRFENGSVPLFRTEGVGDIGKALARRKELLQRVLADVYRINRAHSARLSCLRTDVMRVVRKLDRLGKAIISEGACDWHTEGRGVKYGYHRMTAEAYEQQAARALDHLINTMTQNMEWYESLSQPLRKPQLVTLQTSKFTVKRGSITVKPSQLELDMYAEVLRLSGGRRKLFPLAYEVCRLQHYAKAVIAANNQQAQAIEEMYLLTTARGVWRVILACEDKFPEQFVTNLSRVVLHEVDWLLAEPSRFDGEEPSCVLASADNNQQQQQPSMQQQPEEPASPPQQQAGGAAEAHGEQQSSAAVEDATCSQKVGVGAAKKHNSANGKVGLRWACKRLLGVLACGLIAKGAQAAATRLVGNGRS